MLQKKLSENEEELEDLRYKQSNVEKVNKLNIFKETIRYDERSVNIVGIEQKGYWKLIENWKRFKNRYEHKTKRNQRS